MGQRVANPPLELGGPENIQNQICSGSESVRYKKHSMASISQSRQSDNSNYQSNTTLKKMDNAENNYADNEGSKSLSSINLKSLNNASNLKSMNNASNLTKQTKKKKVAAQQKQYSDTDDDLNRKDMSDAFQSMKTK